MRRTRWPSRHRRVSPSGTAATMHAIRAGSWARGGDEAQAAMATPRRTGRSMTDNLSSPMASPMPTFEYGSTLDATPAAVWAWHLRPGALERLTPPWERVQVLRRSGGIADGGT